MTALSQTQASVYTSPPLGGLPRWRHSHPEVCLPLSLPRLPHGLLKYLHVLHCYTSSGLFLQTHVHASSCRRPSWGERGRETQTHRERQGQRQRETETQTNRETKRQRHREIDRERQRHRHTRETHRKRILKRELTPRLTTALWPSSHQDSPGDPVHTRAGRCPRGRSAHTQD